MVHTHTPNPHCHRFIQQHNINLEEVEKPVSEYPTFNEFFYRRLKPGAPRFVPLACKTRTLHACKRIALRG